MADDTVTIVLGGEFEVSEFLGGIRLFRNLVRDLSRDKQVKWVVQDLQVGSATATLRGEAEDIGDVDAVVANYGAVGEALEQQRPLDFSPDVNRSAQEIRRLAGSIKYVMLQVAERDYTVSSNGVTPARLPLSVIIGAVTGRVQTLINRGSLRFVIFDSIHDQAVPCYLQPGQEDLMFEAWDRRARVSGTVSRDPHSFRPVAVRHLLDVEVLEDVAPGSYRKAWGAIHRQPGDTLPEDVIRRLRDA